MDPDNPDDAYDIMSDALMMEPQSRHVVIVDELALLWQRRGGRRLGMRDARWPQAVEWTDF